MALTIPANPTQPKTTQRISGSDQPAFLVAAVDWLAAAQYANGGWGAGQHVRQDVRDPHAVQIDPATTAFSAMALMRAGHTLSAGKYSNHVRKALDQILNMVETADGQGANITKVVGTQPQRKLGQNIDVAMASQFLTKIRRDVNDDNLAARIDRAIAICIDKIEAGQRADGSMQNGGWAPVLQSAMAASALETAVVTGYAVDGAAVRNAKNYQQENIRKGKAGLSDAAGIPLYALASAQRATAADARYVRNNIAPAMLQEATSLKQINEVVVRELGRQGKDQEEAEELAEAFFTSRQVTEQLQDDQVWRGFGNNGGEEFLSYMMTSESMVQQGPDAWEPWYDKITNRFAQIQNADGSWSGHHCITSPVFCTAAVILALTAGDDPDLIAAQEHGR